jgi:hypothetical protein
MGRMTELAFAIADRRSEGGCKYGDETIEREGLASFPRFERIRHDRLRHRLEPATSDALKDSCQEQDRECRRDAAKKACDSEDGDAKHKDILAADDARCPGANRQNDRVRDQIAGENPGALTSLLPTSAAIRVLHLWNESGNFSIIAAIQLNRLFIGASIGSVGILTTTYCI